jgi:hypothetical protein
MNSPVALSRIDHPRPSLAVHFISVRASIDGSRTHAEFIAGEERTPGLTPRGRVHRDHCPTISIAVYPKQKTQARHSSRPAPHAEGFDAAPPNIVEALCQVQSAYHGLLGTVTIDQLARQASPQDWVI